MPAISSGSSRAIRSVGSSRISSSEARSISLTSHALASSSRERSRRANGPLLGVIRQLPFWLPGVPAARDDPTPESGRTDAEFAIDRVAPVRSEPGPSRTRTVDAASGMASRAEKIARVSDLISIDEARRRVLRPCEPASGRGRGPRRRPRPRARRRRHEPDRRPALRRLGDGRLRRGGGAERRAGGEGESRAGRPAAAGLCARHRDQDLDRRGDAVRQGHAVVPVERAEEIDPAARRRAGPCPRHPGGANVRHAGEDIRASARPCCGAAPRSARPSSAWRRPWAGPTLACARRPRVARARDRRRARRDPARPLGPGGIYSSNGYALAAQVERAGAELVRRETCRRPGGHPRGVRRGARGGRRS